MQKIKAAVERLADHASEAEPEAAIQLATAAKILTDCYCHMEEVRIHEEYHLKAMDHIPGEDIVPN